MRKKSIEQPISNIESKEDKRELEMKKLLKEVFGEERWMKSFLSDDSHGFNHGNQVRLACLELIKKLTLSERKTFLQEGKEFCKDDFSDCVLAATEIAAIFHDCGRFNEDGKIITAEQKNHHILSAERAEVFCKNINFSNAIPHVRKAILSHDFQSKELTPDLSPPEKIMGKIVQSSDQIGWFHPDSAKRTLDFSKEIGRPFFKPELSLEERLEWKPFSHKNEDALTVMLRQLFGPTGTDRFGVGFAREKIGKYKLGLEKSILKIAEDFNVVSEVKALIEAFRKDSLERNKED